MRSRKIIALHKERLLIMSELYKRIEELCVERKINITTMCKESGASRASLTDLKMGRKQSLSAKTLSKISNYFGVSVDCLLGRPKQERLSGNATEEPITSKDRIINNIVKELNSSSLDEIKRFERMLVAFLGDRKK